LLFGAKIHATVRIRSSVRIECPWNLKLDEDVLVGDHAILYALGPITVGAQTVISQQAHLCAGTHDFNSPNFTLIRASIEIADRSWIAADAFVGPGVKVGTGAILGARGCAFKDLAPWTIYGGNPAKAIKQRQKH
jgi:putative colanic acid biosynthesis acetyltransferase WcaF